ncbi:MAG: hypothetical protein SNJ62_02585 [Chloracidobacterium sp.]
MDTSAKSASDSTEATPSQSADIGWRQAAPWLAAWLVAGGAGVVHQWQTTRIGALGDYAYIMDTAWRIAQGEVMYRDFVLPHSPLTFHVQATLIKLFGFSYQVTAWYCTVVNVLYVLLTYRLLRVLVSAWLAVGLCLPLVWLAPHSIYPHPFYDPDAALLILLNLNLLHWVVMRPVSPAVAMLCGATTVLPALAKQNVGYPYLGLVLVGVAWWGWWQKRWNEAAGVEPVGNPGGVRWFGVGVVGGIVGAVTWLGMTCGLENYWFWVFVSASGRLNLVTIQETYGDWSVWSVGAVLILGWWLWLRYQKRTGPSWVMTVSWALLLGPFVVVLALSFLVGHLFVWFDYPLLSLWVPVMMLTLVAGLWQLPSVARRATSMVGESLPWIGLTVVFFSFLSQGHARSSYGIWAFFVVMVAYALRPLVGERRQALVGWGMASLLMLSALPYIQRNVRMRYVGLVEGPRQTVSVGPLRGFTAFSPQLSNFGELLGFVANYIPEDEPVVCVPHEDPFYVVTGRRDPLPITVFDRTASPFSPEEVLKEVERRRVTWVIVKRRLQMDWILAREIKGLRELFMGRYQVAAQFDGYVVLHRPAREETSAR